MPWRSKAQARWGHSAAGLKALGGKAAVKEWDEATQPGSLPTKVKKSHPLREADFRASLKKK